MSVRFSASGQEIARTASIPAADSFSICLWVKRVGAAGGYEYFVSRDNSDVSASGVVGLGYDASNNFELQCWPQGQSFFSTTYSDGEWFFAALTNGGGTARGYAARATDATFQTATRANTFTYTGGKLFFGRNSYDEWWNGPVCALKVWNAELTESELMAERWSFFPKRIANLTFFNPGLSHSDVAIDWTGVANMSIGGTLATEDNPPISWRLPRNRVMIPSSGGAPPSTFPPNSLALSGVGK